METFGPQEGKLITLSPERQTPAGPLETPKSRGSREQNLIEQSNATVDLIGMTNKVGNPLLSESRGGELGEGLIRGVSGAREEPVISLSAVS